METAHAEDPAGQLRHFGIGRFVGKGTAARRRVDEKHVERSQGEKTHILNPGC